MMHELHAPAERTATTLRWMPIAAAWLVLSVIYAPPTFLLAQERGARLGLPVVLASVSASLLPWVFATPLLLRLCRAAPIEAGVVMRPMLKLISGAVALLPVLALVGTTLGQALVALLTAEQPLFSATRIFAPATMNAMYMLPIYVAIIGIGQALVYVDRHAARERALARARLEALRAQVDPHFLFNVLNAIAALAHRDAVRTDDALAALAAILRRTMTDDRENIPLAEEIETALAEIALHRLLIAGPIDFDVVVSPQAGEACVPALLLRPLVENAVTHGIMPSSGGSLCIEAAVSDRLTITVTNTVGSPAKPGTGLGLANVAARLRHRYGESAAMTVAPSQEQFIVKLHLPREEWAAAP